MDCQFLIALLGFIDNPFIDVRENLSGQSGIDNPFINVRENLRGQSGIDNPFRNVSISEYCRILNTPQHLCLYWH
jgi:hypothetical protein